MQAVPDITFSPYRKLPLSVRSPGGGTVGTHRAQCRQAARSRQLPRGTARALHLPTICSSYCRRSLLPPCLNMGRGPENALGGSCSSPQHCSYA